MKHSMALSVVFLALIELATSTYLGQYRDNCVGCLLVGFQPIYYCLTKGLCFTTFDEIEQQCSFDNGDKYLAYGEELFCKNTTTTCITDQNPSSAVDPSAPITTD